MFVVVYLFITAVGSVEWLDNSEQWIRMDVYRNGRGQI
jgi:hypothetical protein